MRWLDTLARKAKDLVGGGPAAAARAAAGPAADPRMVCGPAIAGFIFFEVSERPPQAAESGFTAPLRALPRHEVWLESTGDGLEDLRGMLEIIPLAEASAKGCLLRERDRYVVRLYVLPDVVPGVLAQLSADGATLMLEFDVAYHEGYESPGGYSAAYGVHYWDDVAYPVAQVARFEVS